MKPGLFQNELLAIADPLYTVIFVGLWCNADREGRLEDRPAKIHMSINAGRGFDTTERSLAWLTENGFIRRYVTGNVKAIQVVEFTQHQNPHYKEPPSKIPPEASSGQSLGLSVDDSSMIDGKAWGETEARLGFHGQESSMIEGKTRLIPDSGFRIPDSGFRIPDSGFAASADASPREGEPGLNRWEEIRAKYPRGTFGGHVWIRAQKAASRIIDGGVTWEALRDFVAAFAYQQEQLGNIDTQFIPSPVTFFESAQWRGPFPLPKPKTKARMKIKTLEELEAEAAAAGENKA